MFFVALLYNIGSVQTEGHIIRPSNRSHSFQAYIGETPENNAPYENVIRAAQYGQCV